MKKLFILMAVIILASLLAISCGGTTSTPAGTTSTTPPKAIVLRWATPYPVADPYGFLPKDAINRFNQRAGGRYVIEFHPAAELVALPEHADAIRTKTVEMGLYPIGPLEGVDARFNSSELPFLFNNVQANAAGLLEMVPLYDEILTTKFNQKLLAATTGGACELVSVKKPIKTLDDIQGELTQALSPLLASLIQTWGGSPVTVSGSEIYSALQKGVVDCTLAPLGAVLAWGLSDVSKYCTLGYFTPAGDFTTINLDVWKAMPSDIQKALTEEMAQMATDLNNARFKQLDDAVALLKSQKMEIYILPKAERDKYQAKAQPYIDQLVTGMGDFGKKVVDIGNKVNAQNPYK